VAVKPTDIRSWRSDQRAIHYQEQAKKLREMATLESMQRMRDKLIAVAEQISGTCEEPYATDLSGAPRRLLKTAFSQSMNCPPAC
jgi:hypothetical protein